MHTHDLATLSADERIHGVEGALDRRNIDGRRNSSPPCGTKKKGAACIDACRPPLDVFDCPVRHGLSTDDAKHYWHLIASTFISSSLGLEAADDYLAQSGGGHF